MPTDNQENHSQNASENPASDISNNLNSAEPETSGTSQNQITNGSGTRQRRNKKKNTIVEVVKFPHGDETNAVEANRISREANRISTWSTVVNFILFLVTLFLVFISYWQYNSSKTAAEIAQKTFEADTAYNNKIYKQSREDSKESDKRENKRDERAESNLNLQNEILSAQIKAFEESQREFEIQNRPFLQISDLKLGDIKSGEFPTLEFNFTNYGKQPVKIIKNDHASYLQNRYQIVPKFGTYVQTDVASAYLGQGKEYRNTLKMYVVINKKDSVDIKNGLAMFYIDGALHFRNVVTNKVSVYYYTYKLGYPSGAFGTEGIRDTTINISRTFKNK